MSSPLADRLRGVMRGSGDPGGAPPGFSAAAEGRPNPHTTADAILGGEWAESRGGRYLVIDRTYGPGHRHGRVAVMDGLPPWPQLHLLGGSSDPRDRLLFVDLETTGLAGGAGTYAFLVGCGWFDGAVFRVRQFFLSAYSAEAALLEGLAQLSDGASGLVSFNGKSFDLPLIETRFVMHRMDTPFAGLPHVDLLHPARLLWRENGVRHHFRGAEMVPDPISSCRLSVLEQALCGVAREGDVPGFQIPARYFHYVRSGDARPLEAVFEHNRLDLLSLALLTACASQLLEAGAGAARTAREALGLGRIYERGGLCRQAREAYARAVDLKSDPITHAEALRCYAVLCRRERRFADAADAWRRILEIRHCPPHLAREATEALAVHHEHRLRDPDAAHAFALQTLRFEASISRQHAVRHRLARLERKLGGPATASLRF